MSKLPQQLWWADYAMRNGDTSGRYIYASSEVEAKKKAYDVASEYEILLKVERIVDGDRNG